MLQTLSEPGSFSIANSICSESVKYSAWTLDAAKVHGQRFWGHHNGLKTCKWRQKMMNYPIKPLTIQLEYTHTGMDEEKEDTLIHSVILFEIDDWENSFDNFHTKFYHRWVYTQCAVTKDLCSRTLPVSVRGGPFAFAGQLTNCALWTVWTHFPFRGESEVLALN